jgi:hypothetical protein
MKKSMVLFCLLIMSAPLKLMAMEQNVAPVLAGAVGGTVASLVVHAGALLGSGVYQYGKSQERVVVHADLAMMYMTSVLVGYNIGQAMMNDEPVTMETLALPAEIILLHVLGRSSSDFTDLFAVIARPAEAHAQHLFGKLSSSIVAAAGKVRQRICVREVPKVTKSFYGKQVAAQLLPRQHDDIV